MHNPSLQEVAAAILVSESNLSLSAAAATEPFSFRRRVGEIDRRIREVTSGLDAL
jgi:hypothetical protein